MPVTIRSEPRAPASAFLWGRLRFWSCLPILSTVLILPIRADFSYIRTTKSSANPTAQTTKQFLKGQKLRMEHGDVASVVDLAAGTITTIDRRRRLYTVHKLAEKREITRVPASQAQIKADLRESGNKKKIAGYTAKEVVLTMDGGTSPLTGNRMQMEADIWLASGVPGGRELQAFQRRGNALNPDPAPGGSLEKSLADLQQRTAGLDGLPLLQIMKIRTGKDGPAVLEITMETGGFSTAPLPDSLFAVPAGYRNSGAPKK